MTRAGSVVATHPMLFQSGKGGSTPTPALPLPPDKQTLKAAVLQILEWVRSTKQKIGGRFGLASERWYIGEAERTKVCVWVSDTFRELCGVELATALPSITHDDIVNMWIDLRKQKYKKFKSKYGGIPVTDMPLGTVYAYLGLLAKFPGRRILKIGHTDQDLEKYLRSLKRQYDPLLLAKRAGNIALEGRFKARWQHLREDGREWFRFTPEVADWIGLEWELTPEFPILRKKYCEQG